MRPFVIIAIPFLVALASGIAAWFLATRRTERRLADDVRMAETKLAAALATSERQDEVIRNHAKHVVGDLMKNLNAALRAELLKSNPAVDTKALISDIDDKLSERMSALLKPLAGIVKAVETSSANTMTQTREALANIKKALRELNETLDATRDSAELVDRLDSLQKNLQSVTDSLSSDLKERLDTIVADSFRAGDAIEDFRWESLRSHAKLPWENDQTATEA